MASFESPFLHLLSTNFVPSPADRAQISNILVEPTVALLKLNADVAYFEGKLAAMQQKRDALRDTLDEYRLLLTPFRCLPDDILREIFLWCLPSEYNALMNTIEAPLLLARVCSRWRSIVYRTPRLWASLHVPVPIPPSATNVFPHHLSQKSSQIWLDFEEKFRLHLTAVSAWLSRSGTCPLSISFHPREHGNLSQDLYVRQYLDILLRFSNRWHNIELTIPIGEQSTILASIPSKDVPLLRHLDVKFNRRSTHDKRWASSGLLNARHLQTLHISFLPIPISTLDVDWRNLTQLSLSDIYGPSRYKTVTMEDAHMILSHCPSLTDCVLKVLDVLEAVSPAENIDLPRLKSFSIVEGAWNVSTLFECLYLPSLRSISYHSTLAPSRDRRSPLLSLISRSNTRIERLVTDVQVFMLDDLLDCFGQTPFLTSFTNRHCNLSREQSLARIGVPVYPQVMRVFLNLLTPGYTDHHYWPCLRSFELREGAWIPEEDILDFIQGRMDAASASDAVQLQNVKVLTLCEMVNDVRVPLSKYVEKGLKLGIKSNINYRPIPTGSFSSRSGVVIKKSSLYLDEY